MKRRLSHIILLLCALASASCRDTEKKNMNDGIVARAFNQYLYLSDIEGIQPGMNPADSINIVNRAIDNWLLELLVAEAARTYLPAANKASIDHKVAAYGNELYRFAYEKEIVQQKMDTTIHDSTVESYFNSYIANYMLEEAWMRFVYVRCDKKAYLKEVEKWMKDSIDLYNLEDFCKEELQACHLYLEKWVSLQKFQEKLNAINLDPEKIKRGNAFFKIKDGNLFYLIRVLEFRDKGEAAPLSFVERDIRTILLAKKKKDFLNRFHRELISSETVKGNVKIYDNGKE